MFFDVENNMTNATHKALFGQINYLQRYLSSKCEKHAFEKMATKDWKMGERWKEGALTCWAVEVSGQTGAVSSWRLYRGEHALWLNSATPVNRQYSQHLSAQNKTTVADSANMHACEYYACLWRHCNTWIWKILKLVIKILYNFKL